MSEPTERAMSLEELAAFARAGRDRISTDVPDGLRPAHAELLATALAATRVSLDRLADRCDYGAATLRDSPATD